MFPIFTSRLICTDKSSLETGLNQTCSQLCLFLSYMPFVSFSYFSVNVFLLLINTPNQPSYNLSHQIEIDLYYKTQVLIIWCLLKIIFFRKSLWSTTSICTVFLGFGETWVNQELLCTNWFLHNINVTSFVFYVTWDWHQR